MSYRVNVELSSDSATLYEGERFFLDSHPRVAGEGGPYDCLDEAIGQAVFRCIRRRRKVRVFSDQRGAIPLALVCLP